MLFILALASGAEAEEKTTHYPRHQIGAGNGATFATNPNMSELGKIGLMGAHRTVMNLSLEYQYFFNRNWGLTANFIFPNYSGENPEKWIPRSEGLGEEHFFADISDKHWQTYSTYQCNMSAGVVYRYSYGPWSFQPSVGAGVSLYNGNGNVTYYVVPPGKEHTEYVEMVFGGGKSRQPIVSMNFSFTVMRRLSSWFSLWLRPSYILNCGGISSTLTRTDDITHEVISTISSKQHPGSYFNIQLGLTLTIGEVK